MSELYDTHNELMYQMRFVRFIPPSLSQLTLYVGNSPFSYE